jgi:rhodanese-related sulfurtransferase
MKLNRKTYAPWLAGGIVGAGLLPILLYWLLLLRVPTVTTDEARVLLVQTNSTVALADVRRPELFAAGHISGAVNWPSEAIASPDRLRDMPGSLKGKKLLIIDDGTWRGAFAVRRLTASSQKTTQAGKGAGGPGVEAFDVAGGMPAWESILNGRPSSAHTRETSVLKQWLALISGVGIKVVHMALCLGVIFWLWPQRAPDLVALRWGLIAFWLGEAACAVDFAFLGGLSDLWEYLHNYGMSVGFAFTTYAVLEGLDRRLIKYSAAKDRCAALSLCHACIKYTDVPCGLRRMFHLIIPASILVALMPLCAPINVISYNVTILGAPVNYSHLVSSLLYEYWYCPLLAIGLLCASWLVLLLKREDPVTPAKILFAAALGPLSFGLFRLVLFSAYRDELLWSNLWEEVTEFLFVAGVGFVLWVFREALLTRQSPGAETVQQTMA